MNDTPFSEEENQEIIPSESIPDEQEIPSPFSLDILDDPELDALIAEKPEEAEETAPAPETAYDFPDLQAHSQDAFVNTDDTEEFDEKFREEETVEKAPPRPHPARKGRPKRKKGEGLFGIPNMIVTVVWIGIILAVGVTLGRMLWVCAADVLAFGREDKPVTITVYESDSIEDITEKLHNAGLIRYPGLFKLYASFAVDEGEIHPGMWDLNTLYDYHALVKMMSPSSSREVIKVMIPEGYSCRQIFDLMQANKVCTVQDLEKYASEGELDEYWFLTDVERGDKYCLEGYLFPDTYEFYKNDSPRNVLEKMLNNFDTRLDEELQAQLPVLNERVSAMMANDGRGADYIANHQLSLRDMLIVASMVEKETSSAQESFTIASVIYNRLFSWGTTPAYLNIDAAIVYALNGKTDLTIEDLQIDSPYNTYFNIGLTPGPIANPGLSSIKAALDPANTDYYFYVLDPDAGAHHFSRTIEEHEAFRASLRG